MELTQDEKKFIVYWEKNRDIQKKFFYKLLIGLPVGLVFAFPILLAVVFHDWYKRMIFISPSQATMILIGVLATAVFFALFRMQFRWEMKDQQYKELKFKEHKTEAA